MRQFHSLTVERKGSETRNSVRVALSVPEQLRAEFAFLPGQHLLVRAQINGSTLRRTYSICSSPGEWPLEIGIRVQPGGQFSEFAANELAVGDKLDVMPPFGQFHANVDAGNRKDYLGFAAGSGITPILSILKSILRDERDSRFALFYGNRKQATTMFIDDLYAVKNQYPDRLQLHFVFSQEEQEFPISSGRLDGGKVEELHGYFCRGMNPAEAFVCGPDTMIDDVTAALLGAGLDNGSVHAEHFGAPVKSSARKSGAISEDTNLSNVTVIMDGHKKDFDMPRGAESIVDAASEHGIDLPYSCKGGVCATCRTHLREGEVKMEINYGLEPWEVEKGFVLACQSRPVSRTVVLDYDKL